MKSAIISILCVTLFACNSDNVETKINKSTIKKQQVSKDCENYTKYKGCDPYETLRSERCSTWAQETTAWELECSGGVMDEEAKLKKPRIAKRKEKQRLKRIDDYTNDCKQKSFSDGIPQLECIHKISELVCSPKKYFANYSNAQCNADKNLDEDGADPAVRQEIERQKKQEIANERKFNALLKGLAK